MLEVSSPHYQLHVIKVIFKVIYTLHNIPCTDPFNILKSNVPLTYVYFPTVNFSHIHKGSSCLPSGCDPPCARVVVKYKYTRDL